MYTENPWGTTVIIGAVNMEYDSYIMILKRNQTRHLFHQKRVLIPLGQWGIFDNWRWISYRKKLLALDGTEAEIQLPPKSFLDSSVSSPIPAGWCEEGASCHQKLAPTFSWIDNCLMVTKQDFLKMDALLWLNKKILSVARGWLSTLCCWEAAVHTLD